MAQTEPGLFIWDWTKLCSFFFFFKWVKCLELEPLTDTLYSALYISPYHPTQYSIFKCYCVITNSPPLSCFLLLEELNHTVDRLQIKSEFCQNSGKRWNITLVVPCALHKDVKMVGKLNVTWSFTYIFWTKKITENYLDYYVETRFCNHQQSITFISVFG